MKKFQFLFFTLILSYGMEVMAQCNVNAGGDMTIVCGDSVQINTTTTHEWVALNSGTTTSLRSVFFTDEATGYVVSANGLILKTTNGGNNWLQSTSRTYPGLNSIYFPNATNGYIVGSRAKFIKTADGGNHWICDTLDLVPENTTFTSVYFTDVYTGYIVGSSGTILKTTDGGNSWIKQASGSTELLNSVFFIDSTTGYIAGNGTFLKTTDGGNNWQKIQIDYQGSLKSIHFPSSNIGYVVGGRIFRTTDGGVTWNEQDSPSMLSSIFFTSENTGYAIENMPVNSASIIWKTDNGGIDWMEDRLFLNINFYSIFFFNNTGYIVGHNGVIFKLDQSGSYSWVPETELNSSNIANPVASPQQTTNYVVTYTLSNGAYAKDSMTIFVNPLTVNTGEEKAIVCGGSVQLSGVTTNYTGNGTLKYKWTPETGLDNDTIQNPTATVTNDIIYTVTVTTPNGCTATSEVKVNVNPFIANAGEDKTIVCGGSVQLNNVPTNYTGNGTLKYKWMPETGLDNDTIQNPTATITDDITYTVTVTTPNGCTATDEVKVNVSPLTANAGEDKMIVCGGSVQLNGITTNYTGSGILKYKWMPETGLDNDTIQNPTATITNNITYTVTVTTPNGCTATDEVEIFVNPLTVNAGYDKSVVCGGSVQLNGVTTNYTGSGILKYKWMPETGLNNDSIANPIATATSDITYTVTVTTPNGCAATDDVKVIIIPMEKPEIGIVSVNNDNKNLIAWNKIISTSIDSYSLLSDKNH